MKLIKPIVYYNLIVYLFITYKILCNIVVYNIPLTINYLLFTNKENFF